MMTASTGPSKCSNRWLQKPADPLPHRHNHLPCWAPISAPHRRFAERGIAMTRAGRRLVVLGAVLAVAASVSACNVLKRADTTPGPLTTAAADAVEAPAAGDVGTCPFAATDVDAVLGGRWTVSNAPGGGCNYTGGGRTILVSTVPLPKGAQARQAALARVRKPCDAGSTQTLAASEAGAFACSCCVRRPDRTRPRSRASRPSSATCSAEPPSPSWPLLAPLGPPVRLL